MTAPVWHVARVRSPDGDTIARFRTDSSDLLGNADFPAALWVQIDPSQTHELDALLGELDAIEDAVVRRVETEHGGRLLVSLTGAGYRDLVFAMPDRMNLVLRTVEEVSANRGNCLQAQLFPEQRFGPYPALLKTSVGAT